MYSSTFCVVLFIWQAMQRGVINMFKFLHLAWCGCCQVVTRVVRHRHRRKRQGGLVSPAVYSEVGPSPVNRKHQARVAALLKSSMHTWITWAQHHKSWEMEEWMWSTHTHTQVYINVMRTQACVWCSVSDTCTKPHALTYTNTYTHTHTHSGTHI